MSSLPPVDRLAGILDRFRMRAHLFEAGTVNSVRHFGTDDTHGYLHVVRRGTLDISHPKLSKPDRTAHAIKRCMRINEPTLLLYIKPFDHVFQTSPEEITDVASAQLNLEGGPHHPLARALPPVIALPLAQVRGLDAALQLLFAEIDNVRCGQYLLANRLFEVVLLQLLRWLLDHPQQPGVRPSLITGLSHPRLARALVAMHDSPGDAWTLSRMAQCAGMSRTAFANTFKDIVGQTPADYLADWRIAIAQNRLRDGEPIKTLANQLGYANASALSRAFTSRVGISPRTWVQQKSRRAAEPMVTNNDGADDVNEALRLL